MYVLPPRIPLLLLFVTLLLIAFPVPSGAAPPVVQEYEIAKNDMDKLRTDISRSRQREPWQKLAQIFLDMHAKNPLWKNRPAALFRSALALDEIARRSGQRQDALDAVSRYEQLITLHPKSVLADDAFYNAARLTAENLEDVTKAQELLKKAIADYPTGDRVPLIKKYARTLASRTQAKPAAEGKTATEEIASGKPATEKTVAPATATAPPEATLTQIAWQTRRDSVRITLDFDRPVVWTVLSQPENKKTGSPVRLVLDLAGTTPDNKIRPGVKIANSDLKKVRIDLSLPGHTRLLLDFSALKRFSVSTQESPFRLIITTTSSNASIPKGVLLGQSLQSGDAGQVVNTTPLPVSSSTLPSITSTLPSNLAAQLGLTVGTVVLDPGHGGKDSGTSHHGVVESEITLDLTRRVGAILVEKGLYVQHTRTNDTWISLDARSRKANEIRADLMVSIHVNASPNVTTTGFETYYLNFASSTDAVRLAGVENAMSERKLGELEGILADLMLHSRTQESRRMAQTIQKAAVSRLRKKEYDTRDGGIKTAPFHVLIGSGMPAVLIETGYCTNKKEAKRLSSSEYRTTLAEGIAAGILAYIGKLDPQ